MIKDAPKLINSKIPPPSIYEIWAWVLAGLVLFFILYAHLLASLLSGLLVYELVHIITPFIARKFPSKQSGNSSKLWAIGILVFVVVSLLTLAGAGLFAFFRSDAGSLPTLLAKMAQIIEDSRKSLPPWILEHLPADAIAFKQQATDWLRMHAGTLQVAGKEAGRITAHIILGMIVGGMLAVREAALMITFKPFARALIGRASLFADAFKRVVFAQLRIATINATFTAVYLVIVLPLMDIHLPLVKTMIAITFVVGLIPVVGNLISNTIIVVVSLSQSLTIAIGSLVFLIVIHKLEYFLNARIVGGQIRAHAWELLIAMLAMEAAFGIGGVIAAPIFYAYIKSELRGRNLI